ncbi:MAG: DUF1553 domain-containing protein [Planctomycetota bacterium]
MKPHAALFFAICVSFGFAAEKSEAEKPVPTLEPIVVGTPERVDITPASIRLDSPLRYVQIVVTGLYAEGRVKDLTRAAEFKINVPKIARIMNGMVTPLADGKAEIVVSVGGRDLRIPLEVLGQGTPETISFHYGTLAALSKNGCNSGGCHGAPSGKGGFAISMVAFDPDSDRTTLTRDFFNRRINMPEPETSLLLRKPLMEVAHRGGLRLRKTDESYRLLLDWIKQGCRFDADNASTLTSIRIEPSSKRVLQWPAHTQQLRVVATFSDNSERDITRLAMYASSEDALATVNSDGFVVGNGRGQVAISVRFLDRVETCYLTLVRDVPGFVWNAPAPANFVDEHVFAKLKQLHFLPSETCSDSEFLRRVSLDTIGLLPKIDETKSFLADTTPDKRAKLIDALLARKEFARYWAFKWGDLLRISAATVGDAGTHKYNAWLVKTWEENWPYDRFAHALLTAQGSTFENPPANYFRTTANTAEATEMTAQVFLGSRLQCAKCHNHPFERWTQNNYYGLGAFFERLQRRKGLRADEMLILASHRGEITQPRTGKQMPPWVPGTGELKLAPEADRLGAFADWLTTPANPFFARVETNRIWWQLLGRGIVDPIDDLRESNPPANPELLDALTQDFVAHSFDRKHLIRTILNSRTYQASSTPNAFNRDDSKYFSHTHPQVLAAEQLLDAVCQITGTPEKFGNLPTGTRATETPAPQMNNQFLVAFGQPARQSSCACERQSQPSLTQALQLSNSQTVHQRLQSASSVAKRLVEQKKSDDDIITELYLTALCRLPRPDELKKTKDYIQSKPDRMAAVEDIAWTILNLREFVFRH